MKLKRRRKLVQFLDILDQPIRFSPFVFSRNFLMWALLGLIGGLIAGLYWLVLDVIIHNVSGIGGLYVIPLMAFAGLLAGLVIHFIGDPGEMQLIVNNIRFNKGKLDPRNNPSMILSSLICVGAGGSLGPESPLVQVTGSTGTWMGKLFRLKGEELRSMSIAGMASGFTALFGAPLGGSLFALEILHHKHAVEYYKAIIPALVASSFSFIVFALVVNLGLEPMWNFPVYHYGTAADFANTLLFAAAGTFVGWLFIYCTKFLKSAFEWKPMPIYLKTFIGGIILGVIFYYYPITRYFSHYEMNSLILLQKSLIGLVAIMGFKILATSVTVTSGWRGGFIIPLFFIGASLGMALHQLFPDINLTLAMVSCMAAINSCVTRTPMSTAILLSTLTGFDHLVPILLASLVGYFLAPRIPFITAQMDQKSLKRNSAAMHSGTV